MAIIFHHIPKAAGSTFAASLLVHYKPEEVFRVSANAIKNRFSYLKSFPQTRREGFKLILGHMPFGAHQFLPEESSYYAIVRDPVKRVLSLYNYILQEKDHYLHALAREVGSIDQFVTHPEAYEARNEITRYFLFPEQIGDSPEISEAHYDMAVENIENYFPSVGLLESYDASMLLFSKVYKHKLPYYKQLNRTARAREAVDQTTLERIKEANAVDVRLFAYLKDRFERQWEESFSDDPKAVDSFRKKNRVYGQYLFLVRAALFKLRGYLNHENV